MDTDTIAERTAPVPEAAAPPTQDTSSDAHALPEVGFDAFSEAVDAWQDAPEDFKADLSGGHRGLPDIKKILSEYVTPEARRFVGNLRADYTRKTQDLAKLKRELELEREAISREKLARVDGPAARKAAALAQEDETGLDPYKLEDLQRLVDIKAARAVTASIAEERKALEAERARHKAQIFIDAHPEMKDDAFKAELKALLTTRGDLDLEDAYYVVKGKLATSGAARAEAEALAQRDAQRAGKAQAKATLVGATVGRTGLPGGTSPPKGLSPQEAMAWFASQGR
jgi:hypothetical protein